MVELTTDSTPGGSTPAAAPMGESVAHDPATTRSDAPGRRTWRMHEAKRR
jgi:hypothetical protein